MPAFRLYRIYFVSHRDVPLEPIDGRPLPDPTFESVFSIGVRVADFWLTVSSGPSPSVPRA
jgi:hypothetical protein